MKKITEDWLNSAKSDLLLIEKILNEETLTHLAAFHAQQSIEKSLKALIEEFNLEFKKTHSLETLFNIVESHSEINLKINTDDLALLDQIYIDARYPGELGLLPHGKPTIMESEAFFKLSQIIHFEVSRFCRENGM